MSVWVKLLGPSATFPRPQARREGHVCHHRDTCPRQDGALGGIILKSRWKISPAMPCRESGGNSSRRCRNGESGSFFCLE